MNLAVSPGWDVHVRTGLGDGLGERIGVVALVGHDGTRSETLDDVTRQGLSSLAHDSGKQAGPRAIRAGRADVRAILFTVAEIVRRYDPDLKAFHERL